MPPARTKACFHFILHNSSFSLYLPRATIVRSGRSILRNRDQRLGAGRSPRSTRQRGELRERRSPYKRKAATTRRKVRRQPERVLPLCTSDSARSDKDLDAPIGEADRRAPECLSRQL